jgi:hypothetical protein
MMILVQDQTVESVVVMVVLHRAVAGTNTGTITGLALLLSQDIAFNRRQQLDMYFAILSR